MRPIVILSILSIALSVSSCSCQQRLTRLQQRCPDLFSVVELHDTVILPEHTADTVLLLSPTQIDTFIVEAERTRLQIVHHHDTLYTTITATPDTVVLHRTETIPCPATPPRKPIYILLLVAVVLLLLKLR